MRKKRITRPKLAYIALRINGGYTPAMDRTLHIGNIEDLKNRGYTELEAKEILESTAAMHKVMRRYIETRDIHDLFKAGFECIEIKGERTFGRELEREGAEYTFDARSNMFTIRDVSSD